MENMMNKALAQAAENLAQLENIHNVTAEPNLRQTCATELSLQKENIEYKSCGVYPMQTLAADLAEQAQSHKVCMETQAKQAVVKARHAVQKWYGRCFSNRQESRIAQLAVRSVWR